MAAYVGREMRDFNERPEERGTVRQDDRPGGGVKQGSDWVNSVASSGWLLPKATKFTPFLKILGNLLSWVWWEKILLTLRHTTGWPPPPCLTFYLVTSRWGRLKTGTGYVTGPFPHLFTRNIHGKRLPVLALSPYTNIFCEAPLPPPQRG